MPAQPPGARTVLAMIPSGTADMPLAAARALFAPPLSRVALDWDAAHAAGVSAQVRLHRGPAPQSWLTCWYVDAGARACGWDDANARAVTVSLAGALFTAGPGERGTHLQALEDAMRAQGGPVSLTVLTWALPGGRTLLLDGNHRVVAASRVGAEVALVELRLRGPADPSLLPDLTHHSRGLPRPGAGRVSAGDLPGGACAAAAAPAETGGASRRAHDADTA